MLRLRHRSGQGDAEAGGLGEISRAQAMCGKSLRIEACLGAAALQDQIDSLWGEGALAKPLPPIDRPEYCALADVCPLEPLA